MPANAALDAAARRVTPGACEGTLGTWRSRPPGGHRTLSRVWLVPNGRNESAGKPPLAGVYARCRLSLATAGQACEGQPRSEPDSGKPTVRDRREALGTVAYGDTVDPPRNRKGGDGNPTPTSKRAQDLSRPLILETEANGIKP